MNQDTPNRALRLRRRLLVLAASTVILLFAIGALLDGFSLESISALALGTLALVLPFVVYQDSIESVTGSYVVGGILSVCLLAILAFLLLSESSTAGLMIFSYYLVVGVVLAVGNALDKRARA